MLEIAAIHPKEFSEASNVIAQSWHFAYCGLIDENYLNSLPSDLWVPFLTEGFLNGTLHCIVAKEDHMIVGVCIFRASQFEQFPSDGELTALYLLPQVIGKGIGSKLLFQAEHALQELGYLHCALSILDGNTRASKFYHSHGFSDTLLSENVTLGNQTLSCAIMRKEL